jgi:hypothetical protein
VAGSCPDTRANNYAVSSLNIVNKCSDEIQAADTATCNNVISKGAQLGSVSPQLANCLFSRKHAPLHSKAARSR